MTQLLTIHERIIAISKVIDVTGLSKSTIYSYMQMGKFPTPIKLGARRVGWRECEVQSWLKTKIELSRFN